MPQPAPGHVGDVQQPIHPIEIEECAEVSDVFHCASYSVAPVTPSMTFRLFSLRSFSITSRRLSTTFLRSSLSLTILKSYVLPTNCCKSFGGTTSIWDAGKN